MRETKRAPEGFDGSGDPDRERPAGSDDTQIRTFMIADVRGYTAFTQERGDEAAAELAARFAELVREHVEANEGALVELRGDEALAVFASPRRAIRAAVELQSALLEHTRSQSALPLPVGIGIDAGEAVPMGDGYRGGALNLASRLCGEAGPGEILGSQSVVHLARTLEGIRYLDRGEIQLKGLSEPVRVLSITSEEQDVAAQMAKLLPRRPERRAASGRMQFRVLGPVEVVQGDQTLSLGGPKQRAVLAHLVIRANQPISAEHLIEAIWSDQVPESARNTLYSYVSHLRRVLGHDRIESQTPGYRLRLDPAELDAARFEQLLKDADKGKAVNPRGAAAVLDEALGLWRGSALSDVAEDGALLAEAARLDELRLRATEERIEALLAAGEQSRVISEAETLIERYPLRERIWLQLMLALYRDGRQAEALNAYQRVREILADELGIDPSPELVRLHERILKQDPGLELQGEPLRGYRLLEKIDEGPTGVVYRAIQPHVGRDVAVKIIHEHLASDPSFVRGFERDAQAVAALEHPHIVPVYDYWREPERAYIVSRYLKEGSLRGIESRGERLERDRALLSVEQIATALAFAHGRQVAHGYVSASNVLFDGEGNAYLGDFRIGVALTQKAAEADVRDLALLARDLLGSEEIPPALAELMEHVATGSDSVTAADIATAVGIRAPSPDEAPEPEIQVRNPYKGLRAFTEADAQDFFGRGELITRLLSRLSKGGRKSRVLAVVGPSGGGKSSVVRAGVVPAIRGGAAGDPEQTFVAEMFPGQHPLDELEAALLRVSTHPTSRLPDLLDQGSRGLLEAMDLVLPTPAELVLVVDQFEEVFTLTSDEHEREAFLESLRVATADPESRLRLILTLRADFYDRPLVYPRFGEVLAAATEVVSPLTPDETEQAIRRPAEGVGISVEPGLLAEIIADVAHQPGALPLLQYGLTELFERREGDRLTLDAYREIGGVAGALSARAERIFEATSKEGKRTTKQVFLRLVTLGEGREDTRRRVIRSELDALEVDTQVVDRLIDTFGRHRLLTFDREPSTREPTVEIAHEALLGAWERLRTWIDDARDDLRQDRRLARAAGEWRGSGRDPSFLVRGARLEQLEAWASSTDLAIGLPEREYLKASLDQRDLELREEEARREREERIERRSRSRLKALVAVLAAAALVASGLTLIAVGQRRESARQARIAFARELAAASVANLEVDPERSILLALEAVDQTRSADGFVLREAEQALHWAVVSSRIDMSIPGQSLGVDWSSSGLIATTRVVGAGGQSEGVVIDIKDPATGAILRTMDGHQGKPRWDSRNLAFSSDGSMLTTTGADGWLKVWDPSTGDLLTSDHWSGESLGPSFSADGSLVAAIWNDKPGHGTVRVVDLSTHLEKEFTVPGSNDAALSPDGTKIALASGSSLLVIDLQTGDVLRREGPYNQDFVRISWSPDGRYLASGGWYKEVLIWDTRHWRALPTLPGVGTFALDWSSDSSRLATVADDGVTRVWNIAKEGAREIERLPSDRGTVEVAFSPDGANLSTAGDSRTLIWDLRANADAEWANITGLSDTLFAPDGSLIASTSDGRVISLDPATGVVQKEMGAFELVEGKRVLGVHLSPDGSSIAIHYKGPGPRLYNPGPLSVQDVASGQELFFVSEPVQEPNWFAEGQHLAVTTDDEDILIFDRSGELLDTIEREPGFHTSATALSPDGRQWAAIEYKGETDVAANYRLRIWNWERGELVREIPGVKADHLAFDQTGTRIATNADRHEIWNAETGELISRLPALPDEGTYDLEFSPDGSRLAVSHSDGKLRLFDVASGQETLALVGHDDYFGGLSFSPDGSMLVSADGDGTRIWALDLDDLLAIARREVTRSLTNAECWQYLHLVRCPR
jgi:DNA-binding SARP family transcriptional activator/WD40 repeat protein/class 3 adenylate cyclase/tRNA A-37 threonylcarbamoyl transferase component Bud32